MGTCDISCHQLWGRPSSQTNLFGGFNPMFSKYAHQRGSLSIWLKCGEEKYWKPATSRVVTFLWSPKPTRVLYSISLQSDKRKSSQASWPRRNHNLGSVPAHPWGSAKAFPPAFSRPFWETNACRKRKVQTRFWDQHEWYIYVYIYIYHMMSCI